MIEYSPALDLPPPCRQIQAAFTTKIMAIDAVCRTPPIKKVVLTNNLPLQSLTRSTRRKPIDEIPSSSFNVFDSRLPSLSSLLLLKQPPCRRKYHCEAATSAGRTGDNRDGEEEKAASYEEVNEALQMDGQIPESSDKFVKQVSSRAYGMRRQLQQSMESSSYDVLEANPWRGDSKAVYVLAQGENQLWTMRTRRPRSEVERELGLLFPKKGTKRKDKETQRKNSGSDTRFQMLVEDVREGVLVFEDEEDAAKYCDLLEGCAGVAELDASSVFDLCRKMKALAVFFRRGRSHPLPDSLKLDLKARKRSLEDQV